MIEAPIHIVPHDPSWVAKFEAEKAQLETLLGPWRKGPIEHVGSTAVAGLCAKPVIHVMVGVPSLAESEPAKGVLRDVGYQGSMTRPVRSLSTLRSFPSRLPGRAATQDSLPAGGQPLLRRFVSGSGPS